LKQGAGNCQLTGQLPILAVGMSDLGPVQRRIWCAFSATRLCALSRKGYLKLSLVSLENLAISLLTTAARR
jgi:hypothetical protein